jgi:hypothetical protein
VSEAKFIEGLIVKAPHERAPEYVKAKLSIKREELAAWLQGQSGEWINADIKVSSGGKWYAAVDDWKPVGNGGRSGSRGGAPQRQRHVPDADPGNGSDFDDDDIPFVTNRGRF